MANPKPNSKEKVMIVITYVTISIFFFFTKKDIERDNITASFYNLSWKHCLS